MTTEEVQRSLRRCGIIGAGSSGLTAAKWALEYGFEPVVFERDVSLGGLWRYKSDDTKLGTVMRSTIINSSKEMSCYSDFPPASNLPCYMHNTDLLQYFTDYATHYGLHEHIRFQHTVTAVKRADDYDRSGRWMMEVRDNNANEFVDTFDCVLICVGHHTTPYIPEKMWPGADEFKGKFKHAHSYKDHVGYEKKNAVVVGVGNSALDIAVELSHINRRVYLSTRRGAWIFNRVGQYGYPNDMINLTRLNMCVLGSIFPRWLVEWLWTREAQKHFDHDNFGLRPNHSFFAQHITVNDEIANRIMSGTLVVKPNIREFRAPNTVVFDNDTLVNDVDEVLLCTGYKFDFNFVEDGELIPVKNNYTPLYKYMYPTRLMDKNTLAIIGHIQPIGSIVPIAEMQTRVFFEAMSGRIKLPPKNEMLADVEHKRIVNLEKYTLSPRHTIQVDYIDFMDELAEIIGARPSLARIALTDPTLAYCMLVEANVPYVYRLCGPRVWPGARDAILGARKRVENAQRTRDTNYDKASSTTPSKISSTICAEKYQSNLILYACVLAALIVLLGVYFVF